MIMPFLPASFVPLDRAEVGVLLGGLALIAFVLWYFFGPQVRGRSGQRGGRRGDRSRGQGS
jgi:hypothetical protein